MKVVSEVLISRMNVGVEAKVRQAENIYLTGYCPLEANFDQGRPAARRASRIISRKGWKGESDRSFAGTTG